jgi:hypothetical protein
MTTTHYATFDGEVFRPEGPVGMEPNTRVRITVETDAEPEPEPASHVANMDDGDPYLFLRLLREANFDGPPDWSERFHYYMYGDDSRSET